jgi:hypothetical protein
MGISQIRKVIEAELSDVGVVITFDNDKTALYPADLLYAHIEECKTLEALPADLITPE